ncbi:hypothetical protein EVAR_80297_1 [Eumeta japonica]|uniref:Uncharacterized protein n=1 Tax=Eumeta variegata TaxID=151549 RepID=A0A4C1UC16_EUMVA|nr:hypothetical protein EVAR_80297_1 [Eumeta japonica]
MKRWLKPNDSGLDEANEKPSTSKRREAIFEVLNNFRSTHGIPWDKCVAFSTDGALAMTGTRIGLQARMKTNPSIM